MEMARFLEPYGLDYWHIDSREDISVLEDIRGINAISETPIDLHIITKSPRRFLDNLEGLDIARIAFQVEEIEENYHFSKIPNTEIGLAIQIGNPNLYALVEQYACEVDYILLMMTTPGVSGGKFDQNHFSTIRQLVHQYPDVSWCVDGGVNHEISYILRLIGVDSVVVGSYITGHENMAKAILEIQSRRVKSEYHISDYMTPTYLLPTVEEDHTVQNMLEQLEKGKIGVVFVLSKGGKFQGIISNADIRRVLIKANFSYEMSLSEYINRQPRVMQDIATTAEMIDFLDLTKFPILVLPIIDKFETLKGAISFHKLLKND